jgi:lipopolysaccharide export system permease protein
MSILFRYLWRQAFFYFLLCLGVGVGVYLLVDLFSRMPNLLDSGLPVGTIGLYFLAKIPLVVSQSLPAVLLLALVLLLSLMHRSNEILALETGGVAPKVFILFFLCLGCVLFVFQLLFTQFVVVKGEQMANRIWSEGVKSRYLEEQVLRDVWFQEGRRTVHLISYLPYKGEGKGVSIYFRSEGGEAIEKILNAEGMRLSGQEWFLQNVLEHEPERFLVQRYETFPIMFRQDMQALSMTVEIKDDGTSFDPVALPLWELSRHIERLQETGSNVERLRTSWHMKWSYAFSMVVMALVAASWMGILSNIYLNIGMSMFVVFIFYMLFLSGISAAQEGMVPPWFGAWMGNILLGGGALLRLAFLKRAV